MDKLIQGFSKRLSVFFAKNRSYRIPDWDKMSDSMWADLARQDVAVKIPEMDYNAFCDIMVDLDAKHSAILKYGGENMAIGTDINITKEFYRRMTERGWQSPQSRNNESA